jgi:hypothetical protein
MLPLGFFLWFHPDTIRLWGDEVFHVPKEVRLHAHVPKHSGRNENALDSRDAIHQADTPTSASNPVTFLWVIRSVWDGHAAERPVTHARYGTTVARIRKVALLAMY